MVETVPKKLVRAATACTLARVLPEVRSLCTSRHLGLAYPVEKCFWQCRSRPGCTRADNAYVFHFNGVQQIRCRTACAVSEDRGGRARRNTAGRKLLLPAQTAGGGCPGILPADTFGTTSAESPLAAALDRRRPATLEVDVRGHTRACRYGAALAWLRRRGTGP